MSNDEGNKLTIEASEFQRLQVRNATEFAGLVSSSSMTCFAILFTNTYHVYLLVNHKFMLFHYV